MEIIKNLGSLLISPRFMSFYWRTGAIAGVGFLNLISEGMANLGLPGWGVVVAGLIISELTKALNNLVNGKEMGFARK